MTTIDKQAQVFTLVNVFTVNPENQQSVIDVLEAAKQTMHQMPGFISANLHKSYDGDYVVNYVQWRRREDLEAMLQHPLALPHMQEAADLATGYNPILCEVV